MGVAALSPHLFNTVTVATATRQIFRYLRLVHLTAAALIVLFGRFSPIAMSALLFVGASWLVNRSPRYRRSPFALGASFTTCVYFVLPLVFISIAGSSYEFGYGLSGIPKESAEYARAAPIAIVCLTILFLAGVCGLSAATTRREPSAGALLRRLLPEMPIGMLGVVVLLSAYQSAEAIIQIRLTGNETAESLWQFIFFDSAYLMLLPIVVSTRLTQHAASRRLYAEWQFGLLLLGFFAQATLGSTSKGFILTLILMSFVIPLSYFQASRTVLCLMPSKKMVAAALVLSIGVFFVAQALRVAVYTGESRSVLAVMASMFAQDSDQSALTSLSPVAYRLSAPVDRFILIFDAHLYNGHSSAYAAEYARYLARNFVNLVLPGTPFLDAYTPSSNLLVPVLFHDPLMGEASKEALIRALNTQPFTIFGVAILLSGWVAPLLVFGVSAVLGAGYRLVSGVPARLAVIYLYLMAVHSYGPEVVLANTLHFGVSLFIFVWLMRTFRETRRVIWPRRILARLRPGSVSGIDTVS